MLPKRFLYSFIVYFLSRRKIKFEDFERISSLLVKEMKIVLMILLNWVVHGVLLLLAE